MVLRRRIDSRLSRYVWRGCGCCCCGVVAVIGGVPNDIYGVEELWRRWGGQETQTLCMVEVLRMPLLSALMALSLELSLLPSGILG